MKKELHYTEKADSVSRKSYAQAYADLHKKKGGMDYQIAGCEYLILNNLFQNPYSGLVAPSGTLGYSQLLTKAKRLVGIDVVQEMIAAGKNLGDQRVEFICADMRDFVTDEKFDFVELGALGCYFPIRMEMMHKYFDMVKPGGILLLKFQVGQAQDIIGKGSLVSPFSRIVRDILALAWPRTYITATKCNRIVNRFIKETNSKLLVKNLMIRLDWDTFICYAFIRKEDNGSCTTLP